MSSEKNDFREMATQLAIPREEKEISGEEETVFALHPSDEEKISIEARKELAETAEILQQADRLMVELFDVRIAEADGVEEIQKIVKELNALLELREAKPCEPPCKHIDNLGDAHKGANASYLLRLSERGRELAAIYKPAVGEEHGPSKELGLRPGIERGTYYKREWLAYMVDRALELDIVPPTVLRREDFGIGSVQGWVEKAGVAAKTPGFPNQEDLIKIALFDYLTGNQDRHRGNYLIDQDGGLYAIDNGLSFGAALYNESAQEVFPALAVRSKPLEKVKEISRVVQEPLLTIHLRIFLDSPQKQETLKRAFDFALGEEAKEVWDTFMARVKEILNKGELPRDYNYQDATIKIRYGLAQEYLGATTKSKIKEAAA